MSGPSTLRLCFAAMAPALTEAASTRLKLQDPGNKQQDKITCQGDCNISKSNCLSPSGKKIDNGPFPLCDRNTTGDRVDLTNGTHGDTVRSLPKGKGGGLNLTSSVVSSGNNTSSKSIRLGPFTSLSVTGTHLSSLIDGGDDDIETNGFLVGLKRMSQPYFTAAIDDQSVESSKPKSHFNSSDTLRILASKVVSQTGMVNGGNGNDKEKEVEPESVKQSCVRESGDALSGEELRTNRIPEQKKGPLKFILPVDTDNTGKKTMGMCGKGEVVLKLEKESELQPGATRLELEKPCEDVRKDCVKKQAFLERKVETLMRRLKRVKGKVVETHTKEQLVQYVNFQHRNLQMVAKSIKSEAPCPEMLKEHFLSNEDVKNMSTSQLVKLVRDHQSNKSLPITDNSRYRMMNASASIMSPSLQTQAHTTSERLSLRVQSMENELDSDATVSSSGGESCDEESTPCPPRDTALPSLCKRAEWKWAADRASIVARWTWLQAQVSDLEYKIRQQSQVHRQLRNTKGGVVLGDPPSAVDILRKLQGFTPNNKSSSHNCASTVEENSFAVPEGSSSTEVSPYNITRLLSNVDRQASRLSQSLNCISPSSSTVGSPGVATKATSPMTSTGVVESPSSSSLGSDIAEMTDSSPLVVSAPSSSSSLLADFAQQRELPSLHHSLQLHASTSSISDASFQAARCRPLRSYRKRKVLRTIDLYKSSVKAARLSDIRCHCYPPSNPCAMCGGRYNNTLPMDAENMSFNERVALLDSSFHPVLSFTQDIPLSVHCEGFLKSGLWQNKPQSKRFRAGDFRRQKLLQFAIPESVGVKRTQANFNNCTKLSSGRGNTSTPSVMSFTTKIKNKYEGKTKVKKNGAIAAPIKHKSNKVKKKAAAKLSKAMKMLKRKGVKEGLGAEDLEQEVNCLLSSSAKEDRLSSSASGSGIRDSQKKRRTENAYDINNIEIPHSIAASTRVEQIQYKEIVTPKWRVVEDDETDNSRVPEEDVGSSTSQNAPIVPPVAPLVMPNTDNDGLEKEANGLSLGLEQDHGISTDSISAENEETEDLSDEAYLQRHYQPEQEERKRFRTFLQYPPVRRGSRARSDAFMVVNANSSSSVTNEVSTLSNNSTTSAAVNSCCSTTNSTTDNVEEGGGGGEGGDLSDMESEPGSGNPPILSRSLPSLPVAQSISADLSDLQHPSTTGRRKVLPSSVSRRERTSSAGAGDSFCINHDRVSSTGSNSSDPWPMREFPLVEEEYIRMQSQSSLSLSNCEPLHCEVERHLVTVPSGKVYVGDGRRVSLDIADDNNTMSSLPSSRAPSPHPSIESASSVGDDPADPDWVSGSVDSATAITSSKPCAVHHRYRRTSHTGSHVVADPDWTVGSDNPKKGKKR